MNQIAGATIADIKDEDDVKDLLKLPGVRDHDELAPKAGMCTVFEGAEALLLHASRGKVTQWKKDLKDDTRVHQVLESIGIQRDWKTDWLDGTWESST